MPIRADLRRHYRGPAWEMARRLVLARAAHACEWCGKPDRALVQVASGGRWLAQGAAFWLGPDREEVSAPPPHVVRTIRVVLTVAHLDQDPTHQDLARLAALCQSCHLRHDAGQHRRSAAASRRQALHNGELELGEAQLKG